MTDTTFTASRHGMTAKPAGAFGLRQTTIAMIWLATGLIALAAMGGLIVQAPVGRLIATGIVLAVAIVLHLSLRPSKPPPAPKRAPAQEGPSDVIDRVHRQILGSGAAGATALRR